MPRCGSQVILCDVPVRFDTYTGCTHACKYCFANQKQRTTTIGRGESAETLSAFIAGKRSIETDWCDWDIPLHFGGMSDPLQPAEVTHGFTYDCLKVFTSTQYPLIFSTKGELLGEPKYYELLAQCNAVVQVSLVAPSYDPIEPGCPSYAERLRIIEKVAPKVKRLIIRVQPYTINVHSEVMRALKSYSEAGVYGVVVEGMKFKKKKPGLIAAAGDYTYKLRDIRPLFEEIKAEAHSVGLRFYSGENRLRTLGDDLCCCGIDGMEGFRGNTYNFNHLYYGEDKPEPTAAMQAAGSARVFKTLRQTASASKDFYVNRPSFQQLMDYHAGKEVSKLIMGKKE